MLTPAARSATALPPPTALLATPDIISVGWFALHVRRWAVWIATPLTACHASPDITLMLGLAPYAHPQCQGAANAPPLQYAPSANLSSSLMEARATARFVPQL